MTTGVGFGNFDPSLCVVSDVTDTVDAATGVYCVSAGTDALFDAARRESAKMVDTAVVSIDVVLR